MSSTRRERDTVLGVRTTPETKAGLKKLAVLFSKELGTKVTQAQVLEMLISDALRDRDVSDEL